ncbi:hypothetical protein [Rhizobium sp. BK176]|uniref:hypothetical protein n=1 Tax=Rhizobium sp. BK176 TaxID=2587071 RepID=UPI0021682524|nr:hypothetical protein [Rhizobium sp. BK176]MCS4089209.1 hypothetical protein [Rhizobium sp. BK176]
MLEKIHDFTVIVCAFMTVLTSWMAFVAGTAPWYFPVIFLALALSPIWSFYAEKAVVHHFKKRKTGAR